MSSPVKPEKHLSATERLLELRRAYQRQLGRHPTVIERQLMQRAVLLTVRAKAAAYDITVNANDLVRLDRAAQRAREQMTAAFKKPKLQRTMADVERELAKLKRERAGGDGKRSRRDKQCPLRNVVGVQ